MGNEKKLITVFLVLNILVMGYQSILLGQVAHNQVAVVNELNAFTNYLKYLSGELLEQPVSGNALAKGSVEVHLYAEHWRDGELLAVSEHAGTVTTIGLNWIEDQMGDSPSTDPAKWISLSNDGTGPAAAWTEIPVEIAANGLTRAAGTYASTGNGVWTITYTFTASGAQAVQLAGLNWAASGDGNLLCADQVAAASLQTDDTIELEWTITIT